MTMRGRYRVPPVEEEAALAGFCVLFVLAVISIVQVGLTRRTIMATIEEAVANLRTQVQGVGNRVAADVAELRRIISEEGVSNERVEAAVASIEASAADLQAIDPDPNFPAAPPADGGTPPADGGGTPPTDGGTTTPDDGTVPDSGTTGGPAPSGP